MMKHGSVVMTLKINSIHQLKFPSVPYPKEVHCKTRVMLIFVYDCEGILHYKYALQGKAINQHSYLQELRYLHDILHHNLKVGN